MVEARNQVRFEDTGIKRLKHGEPDKTKMAKEVMDGRATWYTSRG
jgi:hypothetical protein